MTKKLISIVIPCFNEEDNVERAYNTICKFINSETKYDFEFVFTDNHSTDGTFEKLKHISEQDERVRVFRFSRNFGYNLSIQSGYRNCKGDAAIQMDADLQDPPELIPQFIRKWEAGYKVVYGIRVARKGFLITQLGQIFYYLLNLLSEINIIRNAGECRLLDRVIINELNKFSDPHIFLRGKISEIGFEHFGIKYERSERKFGKTKFSFLSLFKLSIDAITGHSVKPLRISFFFGGIILFFSLMTSFGLVIAKLTVGQDWPSGFATIIILLILLNGIQALLIGILSEYVGRIYQHLKQVNETIIEKEI